MAREEPVSLPDYIIIGAQRCGTTSMMHHIADHSQVGRVPRKEIHFFDWNYDRGWDWYKSLFGNEAGKLHGEKSPSYLPHDFVPRRIADSDVDAKFIVMLRNPIDRALSHHRLRMRMFGEKRSFDKAIWEPPVKLREGVFSGDINGLLFRGHYAEQLEKWFDVFERERFLVVRSEDFFKNVKSVMAKVWNFLGIENVRAPRYKIRGTVRSKATMSAETRKRLEKYFKPHNKALEELLGMEMRW